MNLIFSSLRGSGTSRATTEAISNKIRHLQAWWGIALSG